MNNTDKLERAVTWNRKNESELHDTRNIVNVQTSKINKA